MSSARAFSPTKPERPPAGEDGQAQELAEKALEIAAAAEDRRALAQAHNILGILATGRAEPAEARRQLEQSLELSPENDPSARAAALNNLALPPTGPRASSSWPSSSPEEALALCAAVGDRHRREAALANNAADLLNAA